MTRESNTIDSSSKATGPAGGQFEAKVGTHYALALLANTEPFGLPGAIINQLEFQRGNQGHPLDDVIVRGDMYSGEQRYLDIHAKRSIRFTEKDTNFASIVEKIIRTRKNDPDRRFAVAIERTTNSIENGVLEALELAQQTNSVASFLKLLETPGRSNKDMRRFVNDFKVLLERNGETGDKVLYNVLRSFSVLSFDYARPNSMTEYHDRIRAQQLVLRKDSEDPYDALFGIVLRADVSGGELNRGELVEKLKVLGLNIGPAPQFAIARRNIEEISRHALEDIGISVNGCRLVREKPRRELESMLQNTETNGGVIEISGPSGVGKSALLRTVVESRGVMSRILVLAPDRTIPGGWPALKSVFGIDASVEEFLNDLACDGGGFLCIDSLDRFRDKAQRNTVKDLLRAALCCRGMSVVFTARPGWQEEGVHWFDEEVFARLSACERVVLGNLDDDEAEALAESTPQLARLLGADHPAKLLTRNLMKLKLLINTRLNTAGAISEAALAREWYSSGARTVETTRGEIRARKRLLTAVANGFVNNTGLVDVSNQDAQAVAELIADEVLTEIGTDRVRFRHDLFSDWAIACVLSDDQSVFDRLTLESPPPFWMARGFELTCCMLAESSDSEAWPKLIVRLEAEGITSGWAGLALIAIVRSEHAETLLGRYEAVLLENNGNRLARLIRRFIALHTQSLAPLLDSLNVLPSDVTIPADITVPKGNEWTYLILWCSRHFDRLGVKALSAAVDLFQNWLNFAEFGENLLTPILLDHYVDILIADIEGGKRSRLRHKKPLLEAKYAVMGDALKKVRSCLAIFASRSPNAAARYLKAVQNSEQRQMIMKQILEFPGQLPGAAPREFVAVFLCVLEEQNKKNRYLLTSSIESFFVRGRCGIVTFIDILEADPITGIAFIRKLIESACALTDSNTDFSAQLLREVHEIRYSFSYDWSWQRTRSAMLTKALLALEYCAHKRTEGGEPLGSVITDIAGE